MTIMQSWFIDLGYPLPSLAAGAIVFLVAGLFGWVMRGLLKFISVRLGIWADRTAFSLDNQVAYVLGDLRWWFLTAWLFNFIARSIHPTEWLMGTYSKILVVISLLQVGIVGFYLLSSWRDQVLAARRETDPSAVAALGLVSKIIQAVFVSVLVLMGLSNLGIDVGALIAGLGIGGIAIALAAQNVLGDLLASLSIVFDKPFVVGDFIVVGEEVGTIEHIGIKTTRLRSISGEELVFANKDLLESRIHNFKRMWKRRIVQKVGVLYSTPPEVIDQIPKWVEEIISQQEKVEFDRCHFFNFGDSSLDFEIVFFVNDPDFKVSMQIQHKILHGILTKFNNEKVGFAFPSRSIYVESLPPKIG